MREIFFDEIELIDGGVNWGVIGNWPVGLLYSRKNARSAVPVYGGAPCGLCILRKRGFPMNCSTVSLVDAAGKAVLPVPCIMCVGRGENENGERKDMSVWGSHVICPIACLGWRLHGELWGL